MSTNHDATPPEVVDEVVRTLYDDVWTGRRYEVADEIFHPEFSYAAAPGMVGPDAKLKAIRAYHETFPDLRFEIEDLVVSPGRAAVRCAFSGTDLGGLRGRPPTGKAVEAWVVDVLDFRDGRIIGNWVGSDWLGVLVQLGVVADPWAT